MKKNVSTFIVFYVLWLVLAGFNTQELILGAGVSLIMALLVGKIVTYEIDAGTPLTVVKYVVLFIPLFIWALILANLQMAKIVLSPSLPIKPGFIVVKTNLKKDISKLSLANAITLTPGTLSVDVADDEVLIHWVTVNGNTPEEQKEEIAGSFERKLGGIFE